ncbi:hypothetical protein LMG28614_02789 [Paraburkholderia ultramafica]|uniref:Uncharacterized protein n=1 Tax=Paraburkholderia ultramafica TaxID=1544867 RepID=A0A6S7B6J0_9BURK|nr:hypothetical protein LMG28614_02789 [Paraburkholderia ultramafica]
MPVAHYDQVGVKAVGMLYDRVRRLAAGKIACCVEPLAFQHFDGR